MKIFRYLNLLVVPLCLVVLSACDGKDEAPASVSPPSSPAEKRPAEDNKQTPPTPKPTQPLPVPPKKDEEQPPSPPPPPRKETAEELLESSDLSKQLRGIQLLGQDTSDKANGILIDQVFALFAPEEVKIEALEALLTRRLEGKEKDIAGPSNSYIAGFGSNGSKNQKSAVTLLCKIDSVEALDLLIVHLNHIKIQSRELLQIAKKRIFNKISQELEKNPNQGGLQQSVLNLVPATFFFTPEENAQLTNFLASLSTPEATEALLQRINLLLLRAARGSDVEKIEMAALESAVDTLLQHQRDIRGLEDKIRRILFICGSAPRLDLLKKFADLLVCAKTQKAGDILRLQMLQPFKSNEANEIIKKAYENLKAEGIV